MSKTTGSLVPVDISEMVKSKLLSFFKSLGRDVADINEDTDLIKGTGASSDEGVDFAIDLSDAIGVEVPHDFNPFLHSSGRRGMRFRELVQHVERFLSTSKEPARGK